MLIEGDQSWAGSAFYGIIGDLVVTSYCGGRFHRYAFYRSATGDVMLGSEGPRRAAYLREVTPR